MTTLFDKYGGFATFHQLTTAFYQKLLDSEQVAHYFNKVDIPSLIRHQTNFLATALGGPELYTGKDLADVHHGLSINLQDFQEVGDALEETLEEFNVDAEDIKTIMTVVSRYKGQIVSV